MPRLRQTLQAARVDRARAVAVLTRDDIINIETGIVLAEMLGKKTATREHWTDIPLVLRVYDRALGFAVAQRFGFENVRSTVELAAPWFIGAAIGLQVLGTFSVGQSSFVVGGMQVAAGSELDGLRMFEMSTQARVIAITTSNGLVKLHPRRDARLHADDTVYLVGPYRELIDTLRKGRPPRPTGTDEEQARSQDRLSCYGSSNGSGTPVCDRHSVQACSASTRPIASRTRPLNGSMFFANSLITSSTFTPPPASIPASRSVTKAIAA